MLPMMECAVENSMSQFLVMEYASPLLQRFISCEQNGLTFLVTLVYHLKDNICRIWTIAKVAHFIYYQYVGSDVALK